MGLQEKIANLPDAPGIYQFKDNTGKVIYVGKAKILKNRVRQYFQSKPVYGKQAAMILKIADLEIIKTDTEIEALILELNLIKELKPRYNVNLKDDKTYPYIVITNEPFPRVFPTRLKRTDGSKYFGPYTDVKTMRYALKAVRDIFMIRSCSLNLTKESIGNKKFKICLDYHIHKCEGPCEGYQSLKDYNETINRVVRLLNGKTITLIKEMNSRMDEYSKNMKFESAAGMRDKIDALKVYASRQKMIVEEIIDRDIFAVEREENDACGMILKIRDGKVIGKSHFYINNVLDKPDDEIIENLISNYYTKTEFIPEEIFIEKETENISVIKKWLEEKRKEKVEITVPKIGDKAKLVNMVKANAKLMLEELKLAKLKREFIAPSLNALKQDLKLDKLPRRIECFDISNIQGTDTVASKITFYEAKPRKSEYRKYKIRTALNEAGHPDDFLAMREVIYRRFKKALEENESLPDLVIIDGGKGQLSSAVKVLDDIGVKILNRKTEETKNGIYIIGLAKKLEEVYFPEDTDPYTIPKTSSGLKLIQRIRDEAHRFAITFHRDLREKRTLTTELLEIEGIGEKTANKLLKEFGSVENLKEKLGKEFETVAKVTGKKTAEKLKEHFRNYNQQ